MRVVFICSGVECSTVTAYKPEQSNEGLVFALCPLLVSEEIGMPECLRVVFYSKKARASGTNITTAVFSIQAKTE